MRLLLDKSCRIAGQEERVRMGRRRVVHWVSLFYGVVLVVCIPWLCGQTSGSARVVNTPGKLRAILTAICQPTIPRVTFRDCHLEQSGIHFEHFHGTDQPTARRHGSGAAWETMTMMAILTSTLST